MTSDVVPKKEVDAESPGSNSKLASSAEKSTGLLPQGTTLRIGLMSAMQQVELNLMGKPALLRMAPPTVNSHRQRRTSHDLMFAQPAHAPLRD